MTAHSALLIRTFPVGKFICTLTASPMATVDGIDKVTTIVEWTPYEPKTFESREDEDTFYRGQQQFTQDLANLLQRRIVPVDLNTRAPHFTKLTP